MDERKPSLRINDMDKGGYVPKDDVGDQTNIRGYVPTAQGEQRLPKAPPGGTGQTSVPTGTSGVVLKND
jgi:hypothetical protein